MTEEATCRGRIIDEARGENGFGYDPYFLIPEFHQTFGELSPAVKNQLSHRARAFQREFLGPGINLAHVSRFSTAPVLAGLV